MRFDAPQLSTPVLGKQPAPLVNRPKCVCVCSIERAAAVAPHRDKVNAEEHLQMLRDGRLLERERVGNFADRSFLSSDEFQDVPATGLGNGIEGVGTRRRTRHDYLYTFPYGNMSSHRPRLALEHSR